MCLFIFLSKTRSPIVHTGLELTMQPRITDPQRPLPPPPKGWETYSNFETVNFFPIFFHLNFALKSHVSILRKEILCLKRNRSKVQPETAIAGKKTTQHLVEKIRQDCCLQLRRGQGLLCIFPASLTHRKHRCIHYLHINMILTMWCLFRPHNRQNNGLELVPGTSLPRFRRVSRTLSKVQPGDSRLLQHSLKLQWLLG